MIDISKYDKAAVLIALYNASRPQGLGIFNYKPGSLSRAEAAELLVRDKKAYFDYLYGRVLKVDLKGDLLDERLYDRDNGPGAAAAAIATLGDNHPRTIPNP